MKIHTIGTSHGNATMTRFNTCTAYEAEDGTLYLVDIGAPGEALMRRKGLMISDVRAVFVSHMHDDHVGGLSGLVKQATKYPKERTIPLSIYLPEERAIPAFQTWFRTVHENPDVPFLNYHTTDDGDVYEDENVKVRAVRTAHLRTKGRTEGDPCSFAYILHFKKKNMTVLHTGDLTPTFTDFPAIALEEHFNLCLCEATHYKPEVAIPTLMRAKFDRLIFIHIADRWHLSLPNPYEVTNGERNLLEAYKCLPYPIAIAHDGDTFWYN